MNYLELLQIAIEASALAGKEILQVYNTNFFVETKSDNTPVTEADKASGRCITKVLIQSGIPVISEEEEIVDYNMRKSWKQVWIVDPLDGTKEFVKRNGEFAVNIALVENNKPVIGVIYAPVSKMLYFGCSNLGSFKVENVEEILDPTSCKVRSDFFSYTKKLPVQQPPKDYTVVVSRSHLSREVNEHLNRLKYTFGTVETISVGSSIKQCWVAEGLAHEYPRYGRTMEWDTAAGQCILEQSNGTLLDLQTGKPMLYNKADMQNNFFVAKHKFG